ncbi:MAG: GNAT family N-acetyltransferase [Thermoanaerobaculia bacterium]
MVPRTVAELTISSPDGLNTRQLRGCARLVFNAGRGYYDLIEADRDLVERQIAKQLGQRGTELERVSIVLIESEVAGLHACVSTEVLRYVMMEGTLRLLRGLDRGVQEAFLKQLKQVRPSLPTLPEESLYLARMAVSDSFRGCGVATALMEDFFGHRSFETSYCLHCLTDNTSALNFYQRLGFRQFGDEEAGFRAMARSAA